MDRVLEPELMEDIDQVVAYAQADFEQPDKQFIENLLIFTNDSAFRGKALDLGCGPGNISRRFAKTFPMATIYAVDGSQAMLDYAVDSIQPDMQSRLNFIHGKIPEVVLPESGYDLIFSNSLLHHLPDPQVLWQTVKRSSYPKTKIIVMDLLRPETIEIATMLVETYAATEPEILKRDFYYSLLAAFTIEEINAQLSEAGLNLTVQQISDRHVFISGIAN